MKLHNIKGIILGIGIGLVLSSVININERTLTDDYIKAEASKRGYMIVNPKDLITKEKTIEGNYNSELIENKQSSKEIEEIRFDIIKGYNSYETAKVLLDNGLIANKDEFLDRLHEKKKEDKIQYGSFVLVKGLNYDEIIDIITKPKSQ